MIWVVKAGDDYLQTLWWCLTGHQQSLAVRFADQAKAHSMARRLKLCEPKLRRVRVVKLMQRPPHALPKEET